MTLFRASLLTAMLGLLALLVAWGFRVHRPVAGVPAALGMGAPSKKPAPPPKRDFPRQPLPEDEVFTNPPLDTTPEPEHPWAVYLRKVAEIDSKLREVKAEFDLKDVTFPEALAEIEKVTGLKFHLDVPQDASDKKISIAIRDLAAAYTLRILLQQYDFRWVVAEDGEPWIVPTAPPPDGSPEVWPHEPQFMAAIRGARRIAAERAQRAEESAQAEKDRATRATFRDIRVSCSFVDAPLPEAISTLQESAQINVMIDRRWIDDPDATTVTASLSDARLDDALGACLGSKELGWYTKDGVLVVTSKKYLDMVERNRERDRAQREKLSDDESNLLSRSVAFGAQNVRLRDVADMLAKGLGVPWQMDPATWACRTRFTIEERQRPAADIVRVLRKGAPLTVVYRDGILWFLSPEGLK